MDRESVNCPGCGRGLLSRPPIRSAGGKADFECPECGRRFTRPVDNAAVNVAKSAEREGRVDLSRPR